MAFLPMHKLKSKLSSVDPCTSHSVLFLQSTCLVSVPLYFVLSAACAHDASTNEHVGRSRYHGYLVTAYTPAVIPHIQFDQSQWTSSSDSYLTHPPCFLCYSARFFLFFC